MPIKLDWTEIQDAQIRRFRAQGASWDSIAACLGRTRWSVIDRGRRIDAFRRRPATRAPSDDPNREPLPAGHPASWDRLTAGSVLEGSPYPYPVFPR